VGLADGLGTRLYVYGWVWAAYGLRMMDFCIARRFRVLCRNSCRANSIADSHTTSCNYTISGSAC